MRSENLFSPDAARSQFGGGQAVAPASSQLPDSFLTELALRHFARLGELRLFEIAERLGMDPKPVDILLHHMRSLQQVEVPRRGSFDGDVSYALTEAGQRQARLAFEKCQYVGPAPVTLDEYTSQVRLQGEAFAGVKAVQLKKALGDLVIDDATLPSLGSAMNSSKAIYLFGDSGVGKTYLAEHLVKTLTGSIWVPHAIYLHGEVIQVFDPVVHHKVDPPAVERGLARDLGADGRWVQVQRPVVVAGGELTLQTLELEYDALTRVHTAPPQMKANNGIFVIDDLGRQRVPAHDLMNRWIVPLDRHVDYLTLSAAGKFEVPFDVKVIFSSNLAPEDLVDPAFARRLGYKIHLESMGPTDYRKVIAQACTRTGVPLDVPSVDYLIDTLHLRYQQPYLPCIPFDLVSKIADRSRYLDQAPTMTPELLEWAWFNYFGNPDRAPKTHNRTLAS